MLAKLIKQAASACIAENFQTGILFGSVTHTDPLAVMIEDHLILQGDRLILPLELQKKTVSITVEGKAQILEIHPGLRVGDQVALARLNDYFLITGRIHAAE
ncbi:MAG: DUF2577 family protein [Candidatus Merdivicinus sp.]|jgi:hypothetical protein